MRHLFRLLAPVLAVTALALAGASSAIAATPTSASLDANWCFQDASMTYCFDVDGRVQYLDSKTGSSVSANQITRTSYYRSGEYIGQSKAVEHLRGVFKADGTVVLQSSIHTRSTVDGEDCVYHMVIRLVDFETVVDHVVSTCGG